MSCATLDRRSGCSSVREAGVLSAAAGLGAGQSPPPSVTAVVMGVGTSEVHVTPVHTGRLSDTPGGSEVHPTHSRQSRGGRAPTEVPS